MIDPTAYVHPDAVVIGSVTIGAKSSIWPCAVLRGDYGEITVGERTSIQDGSVLHATYDQFTHIGDDCVIGHNAHLEGCTIENGALVGSGAIVLHRAVVRSGGLVGAGAVVPNGMEVPSSAMALGIPAKIKLDAVPPGLIQLSADVYIDNAERYPRELRRLD
jgi:carbonic anhydrase/acetyltransferase-like protein (isoleucine patch superfamily)